MHSRRSLISVHFPLLQEVLHSSGGSFEPLGGIAEGASRIPNFRRRLGSPPGQCWPPWDLWRSWARVSPVEAVPRIGTSSTLVPLCKQARLPTWRLPAKSNGPRISSNHTFWPENRPTWKLQIQVGNPLKVICTENVQVSATRLQTRTAT